MNQFEVELIRAVEHGCPFCSCKSLRASGQRGFYASLAAPHGTVLHYDEAQDLPVYSIIACKNCLTHLWTSSDGWIPELAEIVKGE